MSDKFTIDISDRAQRDLNEIADYIFADSPQNSNAVKQELRQAMFSLTAFPTRSKVFEQNRDPTKVVYCMTVRPFQVFYRVIETLLVVEILTVRRGTRDRPPRFFR